MARRTAPGPGAAPAGRLPRWLTAAVAGWLTVGAVALAQLTAVPVDSRGVLACWGLLAAAHGLYHRRWTVAGPVVGAVVVVLAASGLGLAPDSLTPRYDTGPAGSLAPKLIWGTLFAVIGANLLLAVTLRVRAVTAAGGARTGGEATAWRSYRVLAARSETCREETLARTEKLTRRVATVERLVREVG